MSSEPFPKTWAKNFEKPTEVLPFTKYGLISNKEFKEAEKDLQELEWLKKAGLTHDEINLFKVNEAGLLDQRKKIESSAMQEQLNAIYCKIKNLTSDIERYVAVEYHLHFNCELAARRGFARYPTGTVKFLEIKSSLYVNPSSDEEDTSPSTSNTIELKLDRMQDKQLPFYPEGHPMHSIRELEQNLFGHLKNDDIMHITKRRKILRRLERKKDRILAQNQINIGTVTNTSKLDRPGSLWDVKEMPQKRPVQNTDKRPVIGPKKPTMYTVQGNKIVRLEPINNARKEYKTVDIVMPINDAEVHLLEGTKMSIDDIKTIDRFKDYKPGIPSMTLYLKNIAPSVSQEQLSLLFNQFTLANGRPIDVRLMSGRMRGQAFVTFQTKDLAIQALEKTNGTILSGRPIIAEFGRDTNRIEDSG